MENILSGIYIGLVGTAVLFASLGLLSLIIRLVNQLFQPETAVSARTAVPAPATPAATPTTDSSELAAAIAVGVAHLMAARKKQADLGHLLEQAPGHWRHSPTSARQLSRKE